MTPNKQDVYDSMLSDIIKLADRVDTIKETFLTCYTVEIAGNVSKLVSEECYGCEVDHPSQRRHECLMMPGETRMLYYFDKAKEKVNPVSVMEDFVKALEHRNIELNIEEMFEFSYNNCYNLFCTTPRQKEEIEGRVSRLVAQSSFY